MGIMKNIGLLPKTIGQYIRQRKTYSAYLQGATSQADLVTGAGLKAANVTKTELVKKYKGWAYTCASRNAIAVAKATLRLYSARATGESPAGEKYGRKIGRPVSREQLRNLRQRKWFNSTPRLKTAMDYEEIEEHPLLDLLNEVNEFANSFDLMEQTKLYDDITGDAYWYIIPKSIGGVRIPDKIMILPSQWVTIVPDEDYMKYIKGYLFGRRPDTRVALNADQVIHFKHPHLENIYYGMSRIEGAYWAVEGYESMERYETYQTENHGLQSLLINYKGTLGAKKRRDLVSEWSNAIRRASDHRSPLIGDEELDIQPVEWSPREIGFLQGRTWRKSEIVAAFGQHEAMYSKDANRANIDGAIYLWEEFEITAELRRIEQKLNEKLIPMYGSDRLFVAFDPVVADDKEFILKQQETDIASGIKTRNEVRNERGLESIEGGDVVYIANNMVPLGSSPMQGMDISSPSREPIPKQTRKSGHKRASLAALKEVDDLTGGPNEALKSTEKEIITAITKIWQAQYTLALPELAKGAAADFAWVASESWAEEIVKLASGALKVEVELGSALGARKINIGLIDYIDRPHVIDAMKQHTYDFARAINETTAKMLGEELALGTTAGESIPELTKRVQKVFGAIDPTTGEVMDIQRTENWRAMRIARSETARANSFGQEQQWKESGIVAGKEWDAMGDACPFCMEMNGKIIELGNSYWQVDGPNQTVEFQGKEITLKHEYLDVAGPPLHPNCRCDLKPVYYEQ